MRRHCRHRPTDASLPGLTRQSSLSKKMDGRIKSGHDDEMDARVKPAHDDAEQVYSRDGRTGMRA